MTQPLKWHEPVRDVGSRLNGVGIKNSGVGIAELPDQIRSALTGQKIVTSASAPARQAQPSPPRRERILVADDEPRIRLALRSCLEAEGYRVEEAGDGVQALEAIERVMPDLMILDLAMPNMNGMRTLKQLQFVPGQLKPRVIVLTAWGSEPAMLRVIGLGADLYLEKPLDPETLRRAVAVVLENRTEQMEADFDMNEKDTVGGTDA